MLVFWRVNKETSKQPALISFEIYQCNSEVTFFYFFIDLVFVLGECLLSSMGFITMNITTIWGIFFPTTKQADPSIGDEKLPSFKGIVA